MTRSNIVRYPAGLGLALAAGSASAAVPAAVTDALSEAQADAVTIGGLVVVVYIAIAAFRYMRAALR